MIKFTEKSHLMKRILALCILVCIASGLRAQSKITTETVPSAALGRDVSVNVYVPAGFDGSDARYPVLYLLHGLYGTHVDWAESGGLKTVLDELVGTGEAARMVVVMPCAGGPDARAIQNGYFNVTGNAYEDFFFKELIPAMEAKFRCGGAKGRRAIAGLSMGGGGSTVYAQRHPDMFSSCYAMSAWLDNPMQESTDPKVTADKMYITMKSVRDHSALDYVDKADAATAEALRSVKWFIDCGDDDPLLQLSTELYAKMRQKRIPAELRVRNGAHNWEYWHTALRLSLPFATRNFER